MFRIDAKTFGPSLTFEVLHAGAEERHRRHQLCGTAGRL